MYMLIWAFDVSIWHKGLFMFGIIPQYSSIRSIKEVRAITLRKRPLCHENSMKDQINMCIQAVWPGPFLLIQFTLFVLIFDITPKFVIATIRMEPLLSSKRGRKLGIFRNIVFDINDKKPFPLIYSKKHILWIFVRIASLSY